jgi:DNA invertase Pin-like site-specific DNA recombinase
MAWALDRLGRSLQHLVPTLAELKAVGVDLYLHQQAIDTTTPANRAFYGMLAVFAEFERDMIAARVQADIDRARAAGKRLGRPATDAAVAAAIQASLAAGVTVATIRSLLKARALRARTHM